jgi:hemolysin activation/secretion protein
MGAYVLMAALLLPESVIAQTEIQPPPVTASALSLPASFILREVRLVNSTIFTQEQVNTSASSYLGKAVTFETLLEIQTRLSELYVQLGYVTSVVVLPEEESQNLDGGTVIYKALEGQLEALQVEGLKHLKESYVRERLLPYASTPLNVNKLEEGLLLLRDDPLFSSVNSRLIPGSQAGKNQWVVTLKEAPVWRIEAEGSNDENSAVGDWGGRVALKNYNVLGVGDEFRAEYKRTEGLERFLTSYEIPISPQGGAVQLSYQLTDSEIVVEPFNEIGINNNAYTLALNLTQPLIKTPTTTFQLGLGIERRESQSYILGDIPFSFDPGVPDGETEITVLRFNQTYLIRNPESAFLGNSTFSYGFSNLTIDSNFFSWQGQIQWLKKLGEDARLTVRLAGQLSPNTLSSLEQCAIGGLNGNIFLFGNTVRGYSTNVRSGDNCFAASAEVSFDLIEDNDWGVVQLTPFVDFGTVWDNEGDVFSPNTLVSSGLGLRWRIRDNLSVRIDYGIPLISVQDESLEEQRWNFSILLGTGF